MEKSILTSIKKSLGIEAEYTHFDEELIMHINSVFMILTQLGVGPEEGFEIEDETSKWSDFVEDRIDLNGLKTYIYQKVRLIFDPPQMGYLVDVIKQSCTEFEWRLNVQAESAVS